MKEEKRLAHYFLTEDLAAGVEAAAGREGHFGAMWPGCWQLQQTIGLSDEKDRRFGGGAEAGGAERLLKEEEGFDDLFAAAMAFAICFRSPVNC